MAPLPLTMIGLQARLAALMLAATLVAGCGGRSALDDQVDVARANAGTALTTANEAKESVENLESQVEELETKVQDLETRLEAVEAGRQQ